MTADYEDHEKRRQDRIARFVFIALVIFIFGVGAAYFAVRREATGDDLCPISSELIPMYVAILIDATEPYTPVQKIAIGNALQDSIEGGLNVRGNPLETTLRDIIAEAVGRDIEFYIVNSDTASGDPDLDEFDGALVLPSNSYDHLSATINKTLFKETLNALPKQFRQDKSRLMFMLSATTDTEWRDELADRGTDLGDEALAGGNPNRVFSAFGVQAMQVSAIPEDLGGGNDETKILLLDPRNMIVGIHRQVFLDWDKNIQTRSLEIMVTVRFGVKYEDPDGVAVGINAQVA